MKMLQDDDGDKVTQCTICYGMRDFSVHKLKWCEVEVSKGIL